MPNEWLQGQLPNKDYVRARLGFCESEPVWLKSYWADPALWHLNRRSAAGGVAVGLFISWMPLPLQMIVAAFFAAVLRVHVPLSVVMVWFTNPLTVLPLLYAATYTGSTILDKPTTVSSLDFSLPGLMDCLAQAGPVIVVGCFFCAAFTAIVGYLLTSVVWRWLAVRRWRNRLARR
jgi:uncharacterized protein (DUF2062 family)